MRLLCVVNGISSDEGTDIEVVHQEAAGLIEADDACGLTCSPCFTFLVSGRGRWYVCCVMSARNEASTRSNYRGSQATKRSSKHAQTMDRVVSFLYDVNRRIPVDTVKTFRRQRLEMNHGVISPNQQQTLEAEHFFF